MSLRWRKDGRLLCGAKSEAEEGDTYIDDRLHYELSVLCDAVNPHEDEEETGLWGFVKRPMTDNRFKSSVEA